MRMDALHYALLAVLVLLVFYAASTYGLFKEGGEWGRDYRRSELPKTSPRAGAITVPQAEAITAI